MILDFLAQAIDQGPVKISDATPYVFMAAVVLGLVCVGLYRWMLERRRKKSIQRELWNTMSRQEQRRLIKNGGTPPR